MRPHENPHLHRSAIEPLEPRRLLSLTIDLRLPGGGKSIVVDDIGDVVNMDIYAVVTNNNTVDTWAFEAVQSFMGSFLSNNPGGIGSTRGTLFVDVIFPFDAQSSADTLAPVNLPPLSSPAKTVDLDGDTDLDVGRNDDSDSMGFVSARSSNMLMLPNPAQIKVGTLRYTVTQLRSGATTELNFRRRNFISGGLWYEDGILYNGTTGTILPGAPVVVTRAVDVLPPTMLRGYYDQDLPGVVMQMSEEFQTGISASSLQIQNLTTLQNYTAASVSFAQGASDPLTIRWTLSPRLPEGRYRATLPAGTVRDLAGNTQAAPFVFDFVVKNGDATGDGLVNIDDYFLIDTSYARRASIPAPTYAQGDFNFDNVIDASDYFIIDAGFLAPGPLSASAPEPVAPPEGAEAFSITPIERDGVLGQDKDPLG